MLCYSWEHVITIRSDVHDDTGANEMAKAVCVQAESKKKQKNTKVLAHAQRCCGEIHLEAKTGRLSLSATSLLPFLNIWMCVSIRTVK